MTNFSANLWRVLGLLDKPERRQAYWLLLSVGGMAFMETVGVASIAPFMAVVANPSVIHSQHLLSSLYQMLGAPGDHRFLMLMGVAVLCLLAVSNTISGLTTFYLYRFACLREHTLSTRLLHQYLGQPYPFFLRRNTSELSKNMLSETTRFVTGILIPLSQVVARATVSVFMIGLLVFVNPVLALMVSLTLGGAYGGIYTLIRRRLGRLGVQQTHLATDRFRYASEALAGIKDLKVLGRERTYLDSYSASSRAYSSSLALSQTISQVPRYALETVAFGGIVLIVLYLVGIKHDLSQALPLIALYAFTGYRLMPALHQVFSGLTLVRFNLAALDTLERDLRTLGTVPPLLHPASNAPRMLCQQGICIDGISFTYPGARRQTLGDISIHIAARTMVGFVGTTGSGKTTLADIVLGLLVPDEGSIWIDGVRLDTEHVRSWQNNVGYVPQHIFLSDDSVAANIALGTPASQVNREALERAARMADLHEFVVKDLPLGYATKIGERGVRLSGGQRQRIGVARALYHDPQVLVLDEATSAMDNNTERTVMQALHRIGQSTTVIIIAHRLTTVQGCEQIFMFHEGGLIGAGRYDELLRSSSAFRKLVGTAPP